MPRSFRFHPATLLCAAALLAAAGASLPAQAQGPPPLGASFRISGNASAYVDSPKVAQAPDGSFVAVWFTVSPDGTMIVDVYGRRYGADGAPAGAEFRINSFPINAPFTSSSYDRRRSLSVATNASGAFVVVWGSNGRDGSGFGIAARRYDANGAPQGAEFQVNTRTQGEQTKPSVAMSAAGDFIVVWQDRSEPASFFDVRGQRFDAAGAPLFSEFRVNLSTGRDQYEPAVAMAPDGAYIVAWTYKTATPGTQIYARRYSSLGTSGPPAQVNSHVSAYQERPAVAMATSGAFVVAWVDVAGPGAGGTRLDVYARRFDAGGGGNGSDFPVAITPASDPDDASPTVAVHPDGAFAVAWVSVSSAGVYVSTRRYDANGMPVGGEFRVTPSNATAFLPTIAADASGNLLVVWEQFVYPGPLGAIFGQRYGSGTVASEPGAEAGLALAVAPNPAGASGTTIRYETAVPGRVRVVVSDVLGREVAVLADGEASAGPHEARLDTGRLAPGLYVVRLDAGGASLVRRVTVAR